MLNIPVGEPSELIVGDTTQWTRDDLTTHYPASEWVLTYEARSEVASGSIKITATQNGTAETFLVNVLPDVTKDYKAGIYSWAAYVTKGSDRFRVDYGHWKAVRNLALAASGFDDRSHAKKVLDAIEVLIEARSSEDFSALNVNGKSIQKLSHQELLHFRRAYSIHRRLAAWLVHSIPKNMRSPCYLAHKPVRPNSQVERPQVRL